MSGMVAGQIPIAAAGTSVTSSLAGISGGIPAFTGTSTVVSSPMLPAGGFVVGGGAGATPAAGTLRQSGIGNNVLTTGVGASVEACTIELGGDRTGNGVANLDLHATSSTDYELRLIRNSGANGSAQLMNTGTGALQILSSAGVDLSGSNTNDSAAAGHVGEFVESNIPFASAVTATTATGLNVASISLTAGDWGVYGSVIANPIGGCVLTDFRVGLSSTSVSLPDGSRYAAWEGSLTNPGLGLVAPFQRFSLAATTTIYLVTYQVFTTAGLRIAGTINARRAR
jgi:hypothetical protein